MTSDGLTEKEKMDFIASVQSVKGEFAENMPLKRFTSWRVGGVGEFSYRPTCIDDLAQFMRLVPPSLPMTWIGLGSNVLIRDGGIKGVVIITQGRLIGVEQIDNNCVKAQAGASCAQVARFCARQGLSNAEFLAGVPGTMGGALAMNAGCFGGETWEYVDSVDVLTRAGKIETKPASAFQAAYREVIRPLDEWFIACILRLQAGDKAESLSTIRGLLDRRAATQPTSDHSCGSVFRNPEGDHSARLIEACGLKGYRIGNAGVSSKHANFIVNHGCATAADIEKLIFYVQDCVNDKFGIMLQPEVHMIGESGG